jgi:NAD(P)-dependent dehydrogenase (short-subunit alcohol dehydrogenase family)
LKEGYQVAATSRKQSDLEKEIGIKAKNFLPLQVDVVNESNVQSAIAATVQHFGGLDVVVNNAGFGMVGALEELSDAEARYNFDVNVFGALNVIRQALPHLRQQKSGHIFNIASIGGFTGLFPGFGIYCATKFAMHGFTESLSTEVKDFGIHATIVSPGYFRTQFLAPDSLVVPKNELPEYKKVREIQQVHQTDYNGAQQGDPEKLVAALIEVSKQEQPPLHLFMGPDAYELAESKMKIVKQEMDSVQALATATSYN